jgi:hypothetical protein
MRRRSRAAAGGTPGLVALAWDDAGGALALAGHPRHPAETPREYARRIASTKTDLGSSALAELATDVTTAAFAPDGVPDETVERAGEARDVVIAAARRATSRRRRLAFWFDPRTLVPVAARPSTN